MLLYLLIFLRKGGSKIPVFKFEMSMASSWEKEAITWRMTSAFFDQITNKKELNIIIGSVQVSFQKLK